ncbi:hypothetical protein, partial [Phenylobacterium sp.]|uniref:hypothetical protein n=1 Tax=Phenylobacterium sp. TaxID=1871053 RepID=UPI002ED8AF68
MDEPFVASPHQGRLPHPHGGQLTRPATEHTSQTKLATDAKASDSRARRTIFAILLLSACGEAVGAFRVRSYSSFVLIVKPVD